MFNQCTSITSVVFNGITRLSSQIAYNSSLNSVICDAASIPNGWPNISLICDTVVYTLGESKYLNPHNYYSKISASPEYVGDAYSSQYQPGWNVQEIRHLIAIGWQPYGYGFYGGEPMYLGYYIDDNGYIQTP